MKMKIFRNKGNRNLITLITGTSIAQLIPIIITPILTRIYTPEDFGTYSLFLSLVVIISYIATLRYEMAIILPEQDKDSLQLLILSCLISIVVSFSIFIIIFFYVNFGDTDFKNEWLYLLPVAILFTAIFNNLNSYNIRKKQYKTIAKATVKKSVVLNVSQVIIGLKLNNSGGLLSGHILSQLVSNFQLLKTILLDKKLISFRLLDLFKIAKRYKSFPIYSMPAILLSTFASNILILFLPFFYSLTVAGQYALVNRLLGTPANIVSSSFGQIFIQQANEEKIKNGKSINAFNSTFKKLFLISVAPFTLLYIWGDSIILLIFGDTWSQAGDMLVILTPLFFAKFIVTPLSSITTVYELNSLALKMQSFNFFLTVLITACGYSLGLELEEFLILFSTVMFFYNLTRLWIFRNISLGRGLK